VYFWTKSCLVCERDHDLALGDLKLGETNGSDSLAIKALTVLLDLMCKSFCSAKRFRIVVNYITKPRAGTISTPLAIRTEELPL